MSFIDTNLDKIRECVKACQEVYKDHFNSQADYNKFKYNNYQVGNITNIEFFGKHNYNPIGDIQGFTGESFVNNRRILYIVFRGTDPFSAKNKKFWRFVPKIFELITNIIPLLCHALKRKERRMLRSKIINNVSSVTLDKIYLSNFRNIKYLKKSLKVNLFHNTIKRLYTLKQKEYLFLNFVKIKNYISAVRAKKIKARPLNEVFIPASQFNRNWNRKMVRRAKHARVHFAYWRRYKKQAKPAIHERISRNIRRNNKIVYDEIIVTGHSYGGALSILCTWDIWKEFSLMERNLRFKKNFKLINIPFANLRPGSVSFAKLLNLILPVIHRFIYGHDNLARLLPPIFGIFQNPGTLYHIGHREQNFFLAKRARMDHGINEYATEINKPYPKVNIILDSNLLRILDDYI